MPDKAKYWLELCDDDLKAAKAMLRSDNFLWAGFICHLIAEKALKAVIANITNEVPPKTHHLINLAERAGVAGDLSEDQKKLLGELNPLNIEARYPEHKERIAKTLTAEKTAGLLRETEDLLCWIKQMLGK
ncbi:MAG: HEPN domain-containing protein [Oscillospiraceae bacterium]|nr:HEPN domain-containing protein [Oscillospiraceae bacterium]